RVEFVLLLIQQAEREESAASTARATVSLLSWACAVADRTLTLLATVLDELQRFGQFVFWQFRPLLLGSPQHGEHPVAHHFEFDVAQHVLQAGRVPPTSRHLHAFERLADELSRELFPVGRIR